MAQQTLLGGDGVTGETGATHNSKANSNFTELYAATAAAQADADAAQSDISTHISANPAHSAANISFTPVGTIGATNIQDAIAEVAVEAGATVPDASETVKGIAELATQVETNAGTDTTRIVVPSKIRNLDTDSSALVDASTMDITGPKHTLTSSSATRTFTRSFAGDYTFISLVLNATSATYTFPAGYLCKSDGFASGDNTLPLAGVSGDEYDILIIKNGTKFRVYAQNMGQ